LSKAHCVLQGVSFALLQRQLCSRVRVTKAFFCAIFIESPSKRGLSTVADIRLSGSSLAGVGRASSNPAGKGHFKSGTASRAPAGLSPRGLSGAFSPISNASAGGKFIWRPAQVRRPPLLPAWPSRTHGDMRGSVPEMDNRCLRQGIDAMAIGKARIVTSMKEDAR
jgi:hypothetical protein